jgi:hypothetical protein
MDPALYSYFAENGMLKCVIFGRNSAAYLVNSLFQRSESGYLKLFGELHWQRNKFLLW